MAMASIRKEILLEASPEHVWSAVRDVGAVHERLVPGVLVDGHLEGDARVVTFANGAVVRELIVDVDDDRRRVAYAVVDSPLQAVHQHASMQVVADGDHRSRLLWITDVVPDELAWPIGDLMDQGAEAMVRTLATTPSGRTARP
jgi:Polyketide cyclase / dehydrase and lipid transport